MRLTSHNADQDFFTKIDHVAIIMGWVLRASNFKRMRFPAAYLQVGFRGATKSGADPGNSFLGRVAPGGFRLFDASD